MKNNVTEATLSNGHQSSSSGIGDMDIHTQACARVMPQQFKPTPGVEVCDYILRRYRVCLKTEVSCICFSLALGCLLYSLSYDIVGI